MLDHSLQGHADRIETDLRRIDAYFGAGIEIDALSRHNSDRETHLKRVRQY